jgi:hypothetical protein
MKMYDGAVVWLHEFLTLALDKDEFSASVPSHFTLQLRAPITHWIGGWADPEPVWTL